MSHKVDIHQAQTDILRELLFQPKAGYAQLQKPTGLSSDHFNFHIKKLIELGFVKKISRGSYTLTPAGKEHANKLDTDNRSIERQPKVAVLLCIKRQTKRGETEFLMHQRTKHPYFGYWGFPTGKVRWGETILQAAARELAEETNLHADLDYIGLYHELVKIKETGEIIEDKIFHLIACTNVSGTLLIDFEGGHNEWKTRAGIEAEPKKYQSYRIEMDMMHGVYENFIEQTVEVTEKDF